MYRPPMDHYYRHRPWNEYQRRRQSPIMRIRFFVRSILDTILFWIPNTQRYSYQRRRRMICLIFFYLGVFAVSLIIASGFIKSSGVFILGIFLFAIAIFVIRVI